MRAQLPGLTVGDLNHPVYQTVPTWGPDKQSIRMAAWNWIRGSSFGPASWGPGVRKAPSGASQSENVKYSGDDLSPQQAFHGASRTITQPPLISTRLYSSYPAASDQIGPASLSYLGMLHTGIGAGMFGGSQ
jgi:hypothetical protein